MSKMKTDRTYAYMRCRICYKNIDTPFYNILYRKTIYGNTEPDMWSIIIYTTRPSLVDSVKEIRTRYKWYNPSLKLRNNRKIDKMIHFKHDSFWKIRQNMKSCPLARPLTTSEFLCLYPLVVRHFSVRFIFM